MNSPYYILYRDQTGRLQVHGATFTQASDAEDFVEDNFLTKQEAFVVTSQYENEEPK